jgi:hypothetical protein
LIIRDDLFLSFDRHRVAQPGIARHRGAVRGLVTGALLRGVGNPGSTFGSRGFRTFGLCGADCVTSPA